MIPRGVEICSPSFSSDFKKHENASLDLVKAVCRRTCDEINAS